MFDMRTVHHKYLSHCRLNPSTVNIRIAFSQRIRHFTSVLSKTQHHAPITAHQALRESSTGSYCQQGRRTSASNRRSHPRLNPSKTVDASHHGHLRTVRLFEVLSSSSFTAASRPICLFLARVFMQRPNGLRQNGRQGQAVRQTRNTASHHLAPSLNVPTKRVSYTKTLPLASWVSHVAKASQFQCPQCCFLLSPEDLPLFELVLSLYSGA